MFLFPDKIPPMPLKLLKFSCMPLPIDVSMTGKGAVKFQGHKGELPIFTDVLILCAYVFHIVAKGEPDIKATESTPC
jgi:hypothetical protein